MGNYLNRLLQSAETRTYTADSGGAIINPQFSNVHVGGDLNLNVGPTHDPSPAKTTEPTADPPDNKVKSVICERNWKKALTSILEDLELNQYRKLMEHLDEIPKSRKTAEFREQMAGIIISYYGLEESVPVINEAMDWIPRKDPKVQNLLRPFVKSPR